VARLGLVRKNLVASYDRRRLGTGDYLASAPLRHRAAHPASYVMIWEMPGGIWARMCAIGTDLH
jgi:hypothetical protein